MPRTQRLELLIGDNTSPSPILTQNLMTEFQKKGAFPIQLNEIFHASFDVVT